MKQDFVDLGLHRDLLKYGINNMVVNPADIPTTDKEKSKRTMHEIVAK